MPEDDDVRAAPGVAVKRFKAVMRAESGTIFKCAVLFPLALAFNTFLVKISVGTADILRNDKQLVAAGGADIFTTMIRMYL